MNDKRYLIVLAILGLLSGAITALILLKCSEPSAKPILIESTFTTDTSYVDVVVTTYYANNNAVTYSGARVNEDSLNRNLTHWVALSPDLLEKFPINSKLTLYGSWLSGTYIVKDKTNNRLSNTVDILIPRYLKGGCWNSKIQIVKLKKIQL
jgi:3D (Asp-Asp-Asp) domain-containing protein